MWGCIYIIVIMALLAISASMGIYQTINKKKSNKGSVESTLFALERMKATGVIRVEIVTAQDGFCCSTCALTAGEYPIDQVPILPFNGCSSTKGQCRCSYRPAR